ncbi:MAG: ACT domain-containing protein, partial [Neisseriaceae bacterium]|nr:ACT domain-containing protein [Neisseriaceae bacterium]
MNNAHKNTATLLISAPDRKGLVAAIANFLLQHNANILHADQHQDGQAGLFLMRVEWDLNDFATDQNDFQAAFSPIAEQYHMAWKLSFSQQKPQMASMVSQYEHCLADLLHRYR